ncbi:glycine--tRNA ligase subunit beta [Snodgrassella alvi]|uniref:glycine--tRNA ligase subunit beta n=1 Tax=Snodgrassella alvi TaxID=1196083 RepID=UPI000C1DE101|nr:glycine--tRNA ligase subunit beta [Snodgrassella alvi]PIT15935.1 glycine--tRNA ligase subunit beta [Snodgrassella alvi]PIT18015.1 glycine--tRNA ligase subunit beta [Snodgrassella alvi]
MNAPLLIELRTEELPPKALNNLGESLAAGVVEGLEKAQLISGVADYQVFAAPRRLGVLVQNVKPVQADQRMVKKGPSVAAGMKDGEPTKALLGFARSNQVEINQLSQIDDGKQMVFAYEYTQAGQPLSALLSDILNLAIKKLPIPKVMHWGSSTYTFVRPVHGLVMLHGTETVAGSVLGLSSQNWTLGHRFLSEGRITFNHAADYAQQLLEQGKVVASFAERRARIEQGLSEAEKAMHAQVAYAEGLLDEVTALVEWPVVLQAGFDERFLQVPQECLILTMQQNQKYFPLLNSEGKLINRFLLVSNLQTENPVHIIHGNERVLRARLADAEFFYLQDQKTSLASRLSRLQNVVYHNKLGSQAERVQRITQLATAIAPLLGADVNKAARAAELAKADLLTDMVGEFPELQGTMGKYYALHDGEDTDVAVAIEQHYWPRFANDALPDNLLGTVVALADKLETLLGIWGIGLIPTGDKDPYALRRSALGILRMLMQHNLALTPLLQAAFDTFPAGKLAANTVSEVAEFMQARLAILLQNTYAQDVVAAVLAGNVENLGELEARLAAVTQFKQLDEATALIAANKRVHNLLKKVDISALPAMTTTLLQQQDEQNLYQATEQVAVKIQAALKQQNFVQALAELTGIKEKVDTFFTNVMVMDENEAIRNNRLALLLFLSHQMNAVADIALLNE